MCLQMLGACLGAACARGVSSNGNYDVVKGGVNVLAYGVSDGKGFFGEVSTTAIHLFVVAFVFLHTQHIVQALPCSGA
jgi:hypothetical protein